MGVKISQTAKGARIDVHVYANDGLEAMQQAVNLYRATRLQLEELKEPVAPIEIKAQPASEMYVAYKVLGASKAAKLGQQVKAEEEIEIEGEPEQEGVFQ